MIKVKFKSKEAYNQFRNSSYSINRKFSEILNENTVFLVPSLDNKILVEDVVFENDDRLWEYRTRFFNYKDNALFRWPSETDLLEEIEYQSETNKIPFNSTVESVHINFVGDYNKTQLNELKDKLTRLIEEF